MHSAVLGKLSDDIIDINLVTCFIITKSFKETIIALVNVCCFQKVLPKQKQMHIVLVKRPIRNLLEAFRIGLVGSKMFMDS